MTMSETCIHCSHDYDLQYLECDQGFGLPHCEDHRYECAVCHEVFCRYDLIENEVGELLCEECADMEAK